ncbi:MAG: type II toxin-antitoxin system Phd/YefM family antitoxin [Gammaproteobacteria bacterium]|nr:type II toxin-antitoxin system Phd/YefM family antitoxin [Gammaproteobacteria bacterium]
MKQSGQVRPISYLKAHASEIVRRLGNRGEPLVNTQNGTAKVVVQDIDSFEKTQETMALAAATRRGEGRDPPDLASCEGFPLALPG